jgi:hypothetical protein
MASQWQQLPGPFGANVRNIAVGNGVVLVNTVNNQAANGIWRSTNNGGTWADANSTLPSLDIQTILSTGNTFYAAVDSTIYMSTNGGVTWTLFASFPLGTVAYKLGKLNNDIFVAIYYGTGNSELFKSANATGIFVTTGILTGLSNNISSINSLEDKICITAGSEIYISTDGINFSIKSGNIPFSSYVNAVGGKGDTLYCSTGLTSYMTTDGGNLWMPATQGLPSNANLQDYIINGNIVYAAALTGGVYSTTWGSSNWTTVGTGLPTYVYLRAVAFSGTTMLTAGSGGVYTATSAGSTWLMSNLGLLSSGIRTIYAEGNKMLANVDDYSGLYLSNNNGLSWSPTNLNTNQIVTRIVKAGADLYCISLFAGVYKSTNGGSNWTLINNGIALGASMRDIVVCGNKILLATTSGVYATTDGGASWFLSSAGLPATISPNSLAVNGFNVFMTESSKAVYRSTDGGINWQVKNTGITLNQGPFQKIIATPDYVIMQSDYLLYRSADNGDSWTAIFTNTSPYPLDMIVSGYNIIAVGNSEVAISDNFGKSWHNWNDGFSQNANYLKSICKSGYEAFVGSQGHAVWKRSIYPELGTYISGGLNYCAGNTLTVNPVSPLTFNANNKFYVQLSDSSGSFGNPLTIDSLSSANVLPITVTIPDTLAFSTHYRIRVTTTSPYVITEDYPFDITINAKPKITLQPANQKTCEGIGSAFYCQGTGTNITYQWQSDFGTGTYTNLINNTTYQNVNSSLLLILTTPQSMAGFKYRCAISGTCTPDAVSNFGILNVSPLPVVTSQPVADTICEFGSTSFSCTATNASVFHWQIDNGAGFFSDLQNAGIYSNVSTPTLLINGATSSLNGKKFRCRLSDCFATDTVTLTVNGTPTYFGIVADQTVCLNATASFNATVPGAGITYQWQENNGSGFLNIVNGGNYSGADSSTLVISNVSNTFNSNQYQCLINGVCPPNNSITNIATLNIDNNPPTIISQPQNTTTCAGTATKFYFTASGSSLFYQWQMKTSGGNWQNLSNYNPFSGTYTDTLKISNVDSISAGTLFRCVLNQCTYTDSVIVLVNSLPTVTLNPLANMCHNTTAVLLSGGSPSGGSYFGNTVYNNTFYPSQAGVGSYVITYFFDNGNGCNSSASQTVNVDFCTAIAEENIDNLILFPNPTSTILHLENFGFADETFDLQIVNLLGETVLKSFTDALQLKNGIDVSTLRNGLYFISLKNNKHNFNSKFLKQD